MQEKTVRDKAPGGAVDKVVLITGAVGGLGTSVTAAFLTAGARVAAVDRAAHGDASDGLLPLAADLSAFEGARAAVEAVAARWNRIDTLVHLIGGYLGGQSVADAGDAAFDRMIDLNLRTAFYMVRATLPRMRAQGSGRILAIGSRAAVEPSPMSGLYAASKAALVSLIRTVAAENADRGITANVILPGTMDTPANRASMPTADFSQWVPPAQVASLLVYLAGDDAASVNGAVIPIYGGA
ncbi:MAG TPA: SDR family NAD(P)-dependent oxidoreductase [Bryobacteraceae bacterium]|nr:SDR family NAD(P)-dependent oxidoreductase [Bryobacteraceae bacterium]